MGVILYNKSNILVEVSNDDRQTNQLLDAKGWKLVDEKILLGKSLWRRSETKKLIPTKTLDSMIGSLNPQNPPLPSPSQENL